MLAFDPLGNQLTSPSEQHTFATDTTERNHPFQKLPEFMINLLLQQTWQGFSFTCRLLLLRITEEIHKGSRPPQSSRSQREEFSHPVNKNRWESSWVGKQARASPPRQLASVQHPPGEVEGGREIPFPWKGTAPSVRTN